MRLYQRDLRTEPLSYAHHLPASFKVIVAGFYISLGIGCCALAAYGYQIWSANQEANAVRDEIIGANQQRAMLDSVIDRFTQRRELITDIQAWLQNRYDLESVYHDCVQLVPQGTLVQSVTMEYHPDRSIVHLAVAVEGDSSSYNPYFRDLTSHFTSEPRMKVADIQIDVRTTGALLHLEVLTDEGATGSTSAFPSLTQYAPPMP